MYICGKSSVLFPDAIIYDTHDHNRQQLPTNNGTDSTNEAIVLGQVANRTL